MSDEPRPSMTMSQNDAMHTALEAVEVERQAQHRQWGEQRHPWPYWSAILGEEFGEACQRINWITFPKAANFHLPLLQQMDERNRSHLANLRGLREELIDTAAVAVAMIEQLDEEIDQMATYLDLEKDGQ